MVKKYIAVIVAAFFMQIVQDSYAKDVEGFQIIKKVHQQSHKHSSQEYSIKMTIINKNGQKRIRYFDLKNLYTKHNDHSLIEFYKPSSIKGSKLLTIEKGLNKKQLSTTRQWLYLPIFDSTKIIKSSERSNAFMSSHFSYEDISGRSPYIDNHELIHHDGHFYFITSIPKKKRANDYAKLNITVDQQSFVPVRIDFYNDKNENIKTLTNTQIINLQGMFIATKSEMLDHQSGGKTTIDILSSSVKKQLAEEIFSIKSLK